MRASIGTVTEAPADRTIIRAEEVVEESTLLIDGLMCWYKDLRNGSGRFPSYGEAENVRAR